MRGRKGLLRARHRVVLEVAFWLLGSFEIAKKMHWHSIANKERGVFGRHLVVEARDSGTSDTGQASAEQV